MAERRFDFYCNNHGDVCFNNGRGFYNFGYNYLMYFFPTIWLYHKQVSGKNIFDEKFEIGEQIGLGRDLKEFVRGSIDFFKGLPTNLQDFNDVLIWLNLKSFYSGAGLQSYEWGLSEDELFRLEIGRAHV